MCGVGLVLTDILVAGDRQIKRKQSGDPSGLPPMVLFKGPGVFMVSCTRICQEV